MSLDIVNETGFTVLHEPKDTLAVADIIIVHGLQGHPKRTWTSRGASSSSTPGNARDKLALSQSDGKKWKRRSFREALAGTFGKGRSVSSPAAIGKTRVEALKSTEVYWPRDLLPTDCPNARIQVWGYDSNVTKGYTAANKSNLFGHAKDLLYSLERHRPEGRPIIFVAHSLGGLLVKEVLRRSQHAEDPTLEDIIKSTRAVVFLGTPHRGSADFAQLGDLSRRVAATLMRLDTNSTIIRALGIDSPELELSRESFLQQWRTYNFQVKTFQESQPITGMNLGILNEKIVPDTSSSLDDPRERAETIQADHKDMARFQSANDPNYVKVGGELRRLMRLLNYASVALTSTEQECLNTLAFSLMSNRQQNIRDALVNTCAWFQSSQEYQTWYLRKNVNEYQGLLWVKGKPGSGKSTLMKNAFLRVEQDELPLSTVTGFFFNARGAPLERTPLGLFRSLVHQICLQDRGILGEFMKLYLDRKKSQMQREEITWTRNELETFVKHIFQKHQPRRTIIFVDALDECDENTVRQIVLLFADICKTALNRGLDLNICLSSRHYPTISIAHCPEIMVEGANQGDIETYIRDRLSFIPANERKLLESLQADLIKKASGVFLWAVLVADLLLRDVDTGQPFNVLAERLKRVPQHMEDLYAELCGSITTEQRLFSIRLFQWVLLARGMSIEDLFLAVLFSMDWSWDTLASWGYDQKNLPNKDRLVKFLKNASRGLIEYNAQTVQFIHETVREFFLTGPGLSMVDPSLKAKPIGSSHMALVSGCMDVVEHSPDWPYFKTLTGYCKRSVVEHARKADERGTSTVALLDRLQNSPKFWTQRYEAEPGETVLYFVSKNNLTSSVVQCLVQGVAVDNGGESKVTPLLVAVSRPANPSKSLISSLIAYGASINAQDGAGNTPLMLALKTGRSQVATLLLDCGANVDMTNKDGECALHILVVRGTVLWSVHNKADDNERTLAMQKECQDLIVRLIETGAQLDLKTFTGSTPLHFAAASANVEAVRLLVKHGADVDARDFEGPPLLKAVRSPRDEAADICEILISHGANTTFRDESSRTLLHHAARCSSVSGEVVRHMIQGGVDVTAIDRNGQGALHMAAQRRDKSLEKIMRALVEAGCDVYQRDFQRETAYNIRYGNLIQMSDEELALLSGRHKDDGLGDLPLPMRPLQAQFSWK